MKIVLATQNTGKIRELTSLLNPFFEIIPQNELGVTDIAETGLTFIENALIKARHACEMTGLPAIAEDSGLEVTALKGAPGIYSARYAGNNAKAHDNIQKLLCELQDVKDNQRSAAFYCVMIYLSHAADPAPLICQGQWKGSILKSPVGEEGFGYDPIFYDPINQCSAAELSLAVKNSMSHRGQALTCLIEKLLNLNS